MAGYVLMSGAVVLSFQLFRPGWMNSDKQIVTTTTTSQTSKT